VVSKRLIVGVISVALCGCASSITKQRNAPELSFQGPLRKTTLNSSQVKLVQQGISASLKDASARFGGSYKAAISANNETIVCGFVNGRRFAGMFDKPAGGSMEFLPIGVSINQQEEDAVIVFLRFVLLYIVG
jgi:hypothetical protein